MRLRKAAVIVTAISASLAFTGVVLAKGPGGNGKGKGQGHKTQPANTIVLPGDAVFPEGIATRGHYIYSGSSADGTIFKARRGSKEAKILSAGTAERTSAIGMKVDKKGHLLVAGGATGIVWVIDRFTGATLGSFKDNGAYTPGGSTFLNDIAIARNGDAYVTDSFRAVIYRIPAAALAAPVLNAPLEAWLLLDGTPIVYQAGFNLNGIVARGNSTLLVVQSNTGKLFKVKIATKTVSEVTVVGTTLTGGDGMILDDNKLYVVHEGKVDVLKVKAGMKKAAKLRKTITDPTFDSPTTAALFKGRLYVVNSQFGKRSAGTAAPPFTISVVKPHRGHK